jgi:hypothetical protein
MIAIGVGQDIFSEELNEIASSPKYVSKVADFRALSNTVNVMRDLICTCKFLYIRKVSAVFATYRTILKNSTNGI